MQRYVALLRGINVGGRNMLAMADAKGMLTALGFGNARSLLQSGNLVFDAAKKERGTSLETRLEAETQRRFNVAADYMVRTAEELEQVIAGNPFAAEAAADPSHLLVLFLKEPVAPAVISALQATIQKRAGRERVAGAGRELFVVYPDGIGRSKLTNALLEKSLGTRATGRNWNTLLKLAAMAAAAG